MILISTIKFLDMPYQNNTNRKKYIICFYGVILSGLYVIFLFGDSRLKGLESAVCFQHYPFLAFSIWPYFFLK